MGARRFGPDVGRILQADSYNGALSNLGLSLDPLTQNRYSLAGGNPLSFVEWDGHRPIPDGGGDASDGKQLAQATPCSGAAADCSYEEMLDMSFVERLKYQVEFQDAWETEGYFNVFEGLLAAADDIGLDEDSWLSTVDARVLIDMQHGLRLERECRRRDHSESTWVQRVL